MTAQDRVLRPVPLTATAFAPFGEVLEASGEFRLINEGLCRRYHDRAGIDIVDGAPGLSIFQARPRPLPYRFDLVERHPLGSQAFLPMTADPFLVIVAPDRAGRPDSPLAFLTSGAQGINLARGTWHGVLTPLSGTGLFAVIDRCAPGPNLHEYRYPMPWLVDSAALSG